MKTPRDLKKFLLLGLCVCASSALAKGGRPPSNSRAQRDSTVAPTPPQPKSPYLYADTGVLSPKGTLTVRRMHPAEVVGLKQVRKRDKIKVEGLGFSLGRESVFRNNVEMMKTHFYSKEGLTGARFIKELENYSAARCIPTLLLVGHGYGSSLAGESRDAIAKGSEWRDEGKGFYLNAPGPSITGSLKEKIEAGRIRFCQDRCEIYLHACSISNAFASSLAKTTGCHVVASDFKVSPVSPTYGASVIQHPTTSQRKFPNNGEYEQVWFTSGPGSFWEYLPTGARKKIGQTFIFDPEHLLP